MMCEMPEHVDAAAHHVGGDQDGDLAVAERLHDPFALRLRQVAVHGRRLQVVRLDVAVQPVGPALALDEDDALSRLLAVEHLEQQLELAVLVDGDVRLVDLLDRQDARATR